jgi:hypothetical protein
MLRVNVKPWQGKSWSSRWAIEFLIKWPTHIKVLSIGEKIHLVCLFLNLSQITLVTRTPWKWKWAFSGVSFYDFKYRLGLRLGLLVWIVYKFWIQFSKLVKLDKSALISKTLFSKVFPAFIPYVFLALSALLFLPIFSNLFLSTFSRQRSAWRVSCLTRTIVWACYTGISSTWSLWIHVNILGTRIWKSKPMLVSVRNRYQVFTT